MMKKVRCSYDYADKCSCSEDDKCGCTYPNNLAHNFSCVVVENPPVTKTDQTNCKDVADKP
jgi:hypothetical protein